MLFVMASFRLIEIHANVQFSLMAVLAEDDGHDYSYTSDVDNMLGKVRGRTVRGGRWPQSSILESKVLDYHRSPKLFMIRYDHLLERLQEIQSLRAKALMNLLE